ncbi:MAG: hypothetical protein DRI90_02045 [Deltaproteobacteria bacterium]|nr:MAG: hypothetical protein DRI90_02045 [Deltaproteobacteria bacterium]
MNQRQVEILAALLSTTVVFGCGGGDGPLAETPSAAAATETTEEGGPAGTAGGDASAPAASGDPAGSAGTETFRPDRRPLDFITAADTTFGFNFDASDVGKKALERCESRSGGDPQARIQCVRQARKRLPVHVLRFVNEGDKDEGDKWVWATYRHTGNKLVTLRITPIKFGDTTANTITVIAVRKPLGVGPNQSPRRQAVITIPDNFSIELTDPARGRLVYDAKLGLIPE